MPPVKATNVSLVETERYVAAGLWHTADSLPELAAKIGVPAQRLTGTVLRFNGFAASGVDGDFGRGDEAFDRAFSAGASPLVPIDTPPYHAAAFGVSDLGTKGGLRTDTAARVLDTAGRPIPGCTRRATPWPPPARHHLSRYPGGGNPIGTSMLFSHLAVLDMRDRRP
nr:FAD-binding protein [Mycobacterium lepraemurium]